jgi:putative transposase
MTNHVHLILKVGRADTLSKAMHWMATSFSRRFNKLSGRHGHLWEGRFRSTIVEQAGYFLRCMAYLDLNPVRARMVDTPLEYRWCGHRALRHENTAVLDLHPLYLELGSDADERLRAYAGILAEEAERPGASLATAHFGGRPDFIHRMEEKFGFNVPGSFVERQDLGAGAVCIRPRTGGVVGEHSEAEV